MKENIKPATKKEKISLTEGAFVIFFANQGLNFAGMSEVLNRQP